MNGMYDVASVIAGLHAQTPFIDHDNRMAKVEGNSKAAQSKIEGIEQTNKSITQTIQSDKNKFTAETDSQVRKALMEDLRSPFPMMSTEVRLKAM